MGSIIGEKKGRGTRGWGEKGVRKKRLGKKRERRREWGEKGEMKKTMTRKRNSEFSDIPRAEGHFFL